MWHTNLLRWCPFEVWLEESLNLRGIRTSEDTAGPPGQREVRMSPIIPTKIRFPKGLLFWAWKVTWMTRSARGMRREEHITGATCLSSLQETVKGNSWRLHQLTTPWMVAQPSRCNACTTDLYLDLESWIWIPTCTTDWYTLGSEIQILDSYLQDRLILGSGIQILDSYLHKRLILGYGIQILDSYLHDRLKLGSGIKIHSTDTWDLESW